MSTATTPANGQGGFVDPTRVEPPPPQAPPPPSGPEQPAGRPHWYRRGWVVGLIALIVGIGLGAASAGSNKTKTTTVTSPAQTVVTTVAGPTKTVADPNKTVAGPTKTVPGPTKIVTQTVTAPSAATPSNSGSSGSSGPLSWSGNGGQTIGTINVPQDSVIKWTNDGGIFQLYDTENVIEVNSQGPSGQSAIAAGTYHKFQVNADGNWTIHIVPQ